MFQQTGEEKLQEDDTETVLPQDAAALMGKWPHLERTIVGKTQKQAGSPDRHTDPGRRHNQVQIQTKDEGLL